MVRFERGARLLSAFSVTETVSFRLLRRVEGCVCDFSIYRSYSVPNLRTSFTK